MINVSNEFMTTMAERTDFKPSATITFADGRTVELSEGDFSVQNNMVTDGAESRSFPLGVAVGRSIQLEIANYDDQFTDYDFNMAEIRLRIKFQLSSTAETIDYGKYTVTEPENYGTTITIQAVDDMYKANKDYDTTLTYPIRLGEAVRDSCQTCGIDLQTATFKNDNFVVQKKPENLTHRQFLAYAAMIAGGYARMNRQGRLCINSYDLSVFEREGGLNGGIFDGATPYATGDDADGGTFDPWNTGYELDSGTFESMDDYHVFTAFKSVTIDTDDVVITGIRTKDDDGKEYLFGATGYILDIENQLISGQEQTAVNLIGKSIVGLKFRPFTADYIAYPVAEFGDLCYLVDRNQNVYQSILTDICFAVNGITTLKCAADSPLRNSSKINSESVKAVVQARKDTEKAISVYDIAVQTMNQLAANTMGFYYTTVPQPDGSILAYRHDKPTLAESKVVYKSGIDGFWVTQNYTGDDTTTKWTAGFDSSGNAVLNILSVIGINFDWARGGTLSLGGSNNGDGVQKIFDANGKEIVRADKNGILVLDDNGNPKVLLCKAGTYYFLSYTSSTGAFTAMLHNENGIHFAEGKINSSRAKTRAVGDIEVNFEDFTTTAYDYYLNWDNNKKQLVGSFGEVQTEYLQCGSVDRDDNGSVSLNYLRVFENALFDARPQFYDSALFQNLSSNSNSYILGLTTAGVVVTRPSSSRRYKNIEREISSDDIEEFYKITPVWAKYKDGYLSKEDERNGKVMPMFIAEDIEKTIPIAVNYLNGKAEDWNEKIMIPAMFAMLKEQKEEIQELRKELDALKQEAPYGNTK